MFNNQYIAWFFPYISLDADNGFVYIYLDALNGDCSSLKKVYGFAAPKSFDCCIPAICAVVDNTAQLITFCFIELSESISSPLFIEETSTDLLTLVINLQLKDSYVLLSDKAFLGTKTSNPSALALVLLIKLLFAVIDFLLYIFFDLEELSTTIDSSPTLLKILTVLMFSC